MTPLVCHENSFSTYNGNKYYLSLDFKTLHTLWKNRDLKKSFNIQRDIMH